MAAAQGNEQGIFKRPETINVNSTVGTYYKLSVQQHVRRTLMSVGGRALLDHFEKGIFGQFLRWDPGQKCGMAVHHVLSRQINRPGAEEHEMWFEINGTHIQFSPVDFALVTGLRFGSSNFDTTVEYEVHRVRAFKLFAGGGDITVAKLLEKFVNEKRRLHDPNGDYYFQVAHILVLYQFVLAYDPGHYVDSWVWALVDDMKCFNDYPWGAYAFLTLEHYIDNIGRRDKYHFNGATWAFHVWSLEVLPELASFVAHKIDDQAESHPRLLRWKFRSRIKNDISCVFNREADSLRLMVVDEYEMNTRYFQSVVGADPLNIIFQPPRNPVKLGERCPRRVRVDESNSDTKSEDEENDATETEEEPRKNKGKRHSKGKRSRRDVSTSTGSSGGSGDSDSFLKNEMRFMKKTAKMSAKLTYKKLERKFFPKIRKWLDDALDVFRCSASRRNPVFDQRRRDIPTPRRASRPDIVDDDDGDDDDDNDDEEEQLHDTDIHVSTPISSGYDFMGSEGFTNVPIFGEYSGRHSVHEFGHTFMPTFSTEIPGRHSVHDIGHVSLGLDNLCNSIFGSGATSQHEPIYTYPMPISTHDRGKTNNVDDDDDLNKPIAALRRNPRRAKVPSRALLSPYVNTREPRPVPKEVQLRYHSFMFESERPYVIMKESAHRLSKQFFESIEEASNDMDCSTVDLYLMHLRTRLITKDHLLETVDEHNTIILDTDVFISLENCWKRLKTQSDDMLANWVPPSHILSTIEGIDAGNTMRPWCSAKQIILMCFLNGHFVTVRINLQDWVAELYDSLYYNREFNAQEFREVQLEPLVRLFPFVLAASYFWEECTTGLTFRMDPLILKIPVRQNQQVQVGSKDCGTFALMYVERLLTASPSIHWGNSHLRQYRAKIAQTIFDLCHEIED